MLKYNSFTHSKQRLAIAFCALILMGCKLTDLRTETAVNTADEQLGRELLAKVVETQGAARWADVQAYEVDFRDEFYGIGKLANPYQNNSATMKLQYIPAELTGRIVFEAGREAGEVWGMVNGKTYIAKAGSDAAFKKDKNAQFWVPTYQYFIELPYRLQTASAFSYAGVRSLAGVEYELVVVSWDSIAPQKNIDQYLLWINPNTHRIDLVQYTIRELAGFVQGLAFLQDYKVVDGIAIPHSMKVKTKLDKEELLHQMSIDAVRMNAVEPSELRISRDEN